MPFRSEKQRRYLWATHPDIAKKWAHKYPESNKGLPMYAHDENKDSKQIWVALRSKAGTGYLPQEQVRSPLEYRACFVKHNTSWRMTGLEVGE